MKPPVVPPDRSPVVAIMQPYLFPYLGYYQLLHHVDLFLLYDDANFRRRGFIHRNAILAQGRPQRFTLPVKGASQNRPIRELSFGTDTGKLLRTLEHHYSAAPYFEPVFGLVREVINQPSRKVTDICQASLESVMAYLGLACRMGRTSDLEYQREADATDKLISICREVGAIHYVNPVGGLELYNRARFEEAGIELSFIRMEAGSYAQPTARFVPNLSIIDTLMWCQPERLRELMSSYSLT